MKVEDEAAWEESKHPRQPDGKFGTKGTSTWTKVGEKKGSNEGGTYELTDPATGGSKKYYVKFPKDANQALTEVLSAKIAQSFGIATTNPDIVMIDGKTAVASELQTLVKPNWSNPSTVGALGLQQRIQLAKMYYVAKATKNWDVLGVDLSNIMIDQSGNLVQMDTGGSFEFRAQGKHKDYGPDPSDTDLLNESLPAGKVFAELMKVDPTVFDTARQKLKEDPGLIDAAFNNSGLKNAKALQVSYMQRMTALKYAPKPVTPAQAAKSGAKLEPLTPEQIAKLRTGARVKHQMRVAHQLDGRGASKIIVTVIKSPPPPLSEKNQKATDHYVGSSAGINNSLRQSKGDLSKIDSSYKEHIETLDEMMRNTKDFAIPIEVTRGIPTKALSGLGVGDTFVDHAFSSTSFSRDKAKDFGDGNTHLEIRLPRGFKFLSIPSFAKAGGMKHSQSLAMGEAEAILPRGCGFKIREIKKEGTRNVYYVDAMFNSVQPPREKWVSSLTEKREAKKKAIGLASTPPAGSEPQ